MGTTTSGLLGQLGSLFGFGGGNNAQGLLNLLGIGGQVGQAALTNARVGDAISYLKGIGKLASDNFGPAQQFGTNAYGNQNNQLNSLFNLSNPYEQTLQSEIGGINNLTPQIYGATVGAQNLVNGNPQSQAALDQMFGTTGTLGNIGGAAQGLIAAGGQTGLNNAIAGTAGRLAGINPLMSMGQAAGFAVDQAGRGNAQAAETARAQAINRGGGAGSAVANGAGNSDLADFASQGQGNIANSLQNAMSGQQGLQLSQVLGGLNAQQGAAALQQALMQAGFSNALGATGQTSGIDTNALSQLLAGQEGAANIGSNFIQLNQGQNSALGGAANSGLQALLSGTNQLGSQGSNWLNYANGLLNTYAHTGQSYADLMRNPNYGWAQLLGNLGGMVQPGQNKSGSGISIGGGGGGGSQGPIGSNPGGWTYPPIGPIGGSDSIFSPGSTTTIDPNLLNDIAGLLGVDPGTAIGNPGPYDPGMGGATYPWDTGGAGEPPVLNWNDPSTGMPVDNFGGGNASGLMDLSAQNFLGGSTTGADWTGGGFSNGDGTVDLSWAG